MREHLEATAAVDYVPHKSEITTSYAEGSSKVIRMHDDSLIQLHKLTSGWDPGNRGSAYARLNEARAKGEILTGIIYIESKSRDLHQMLNTVSTPLNALNEQDVCPGVEELEKINEENR